MIADHDSFFSAFLTINSMSLLQGMFTQFPNNLGVQCICDVEHKFSIALSTFWIAVWKILSHIFHCDELQIQVLHTQLIVFDNGHEPNILLLHQLLLSCHHFLDEILGEHLVCGHIILRRISLENGKNLLGVDASGDHRSHPYLSCP